MLQIQANELKVGNIYEIEFLSGFRMLVRFTGFKNNCYHFESENGHKFLIAEHSVVYHRFYVYF